MNLLLRLRRCNCWKYLATIPLQALPLILRCRGITCIARCRSSLQGSNWGHGFIHWNHTEKQVEHSPVHVQVMNLSRSLCYDTGKACYAGERRVVIQSGVVLHNIHPPMTQMLILIFFFWPRYPTGSICSQVLRALFFLPCLLPGSLLCTSHWECSSSSSTSCLVLSFVSFTFSYLECSSSSSASHLVLSLAALAANCWECSSSSSVPCLFIFLTAPVACCWEHSFFSSLLFLGAWDTSHWEHPSCTSACCLVSPS